MYVCMYVHMHVCVHTHMHFCDADRGNRYISEQEYKIEKLDVSNLFKIKISKCYK